MDIFFDSDVFKLHWLLTRHELKDEQLLSWFCNNLEHENSINIDISLWSSLKVQWNNIFKSNITVMTKFCSSGWKEQSHLWVLPVPNSKILMVYTSDWSLSALFDAPTGMTSHKESSDWMRPLNTSREGIFLSSPGQCGGGNGTNRAAHMSSPLQLCPAA